MIQVQPADLTRGHRRDGYQENAAPGRSYAFDRKRKAQKISDPELLAPLASDCVMVDQ